MNVLSKADFNDIFATVKPSLSNPVLQYAHNKIVAFDRKYLWHIIREPGLSHVFLKLGIDPPFPAPLQNSSAVN